MTDTVRAKGSLLGARKQQSRTAWVLLSPSLLFFGIFLVLPVLFAIGLALSSWGGFDLGRIEFAGTANFGEILDPAGTFLMPILANTLLFAFGAVALALFASVAASHAMTRLKFQGLWRTLYFLPLVTTV
ncbi:MAG: carbohydrate ABC transporter permease, partial [Stackebrandtia sp.]